MKPILWKWSILMLASAAMAHVASAQFANESPASSQLPRVMSYEERKLRTLHDSGIPGLNFYPRVSGSTSTIPVGQLLVAKALRLPGELRRFPPRPESSFGFPAAFMVPGMPVNLPLTFPLDSDPQRLQEYSTLAARNTHAQTSGSYMALASDAADLILVARQPSPDELKAAQENDMSFDVRPVALDALVFIVNVKNPATELSLEQIRKIYSGEIKKWFFIGNATNTIFAITRDRNSGSQELMQKLVMEDLPIVPGHTREVLTMGGTLDAVEQNQDALAYSVYYYERVMNPRPAIKPLAIDGVLPSTQTIGNRTYPLVEPVYVVTRQGIKADEPAAVLRDWLLSPAGQKLIAETGYAPFGP